MKSSKLCITALFLFLVSAVLCGSCIDAEAAGTGQNGDDTGLRGEKFIQADFGENLVAPGSMESFENNIFRRLRTPRAAGDIDLGGGLYLPAATKDPNNILLKVVIDNSQLEKLITSNTTSIFLTLQPISNLIYQKFKDDFDFLFFVLDKSSTETANITKLHGVNMRVSNSIGGLGLSTNSNASAWGSDGKLKSAMFIPYNTGIAAGPTLHEFAHNWAAYIVPCYYPDNAPSGGHWGMSNAGGQLGGFKYVRTVVANPPEHLDKILYQGSMSNTVDDTGAFTSGFGENANHGNSVPYSDIELYLMGMKSAQDLRDSNFRLDVYEGNAFNLNPPNSFEKGYFYSTQILSYDIDDLITQAGPRTPDFASSQKNFKVLTVMLTDETGEDHTDTIIRQMEWFAGEVGATDDSIVSYIYNFARATGGVGSLEVEGIKQQPAPLDQSALLASRWYDRRGLQRDAFRNCFKRRHPNVER
jgi:hypothetical protein